MAGELGKASLDLEANLGPFERNLETAHAAGDRLQHALDALAAVADVCQKALNDVKLDSSKAAESRIGAEQIISGVRGISDESRMAAIELDKVKLGPEQATETDAAGDVIDHKLDEIRDKAIETQLALDRVRLRLDNARGGGGEFKRAGYGFGPFGAGYGRIGLVGTAIGLGAALAPAAGPAALGLLAAIPAMAGVGVAALGTLYLAFSGLSKAIAGNKQAFDALSKPAQQFVQTIRSLSGWLKQLKLDAAKAIFPGLTTGLKDALSPGTVSAITKAITEIGKAIGKVATMFGNYFGSKEFQSIFGPLMASAARNIAVMGNAFLHLFDALGVFMRAAIPFTNWLVSAIDKGAKLADSWLHAKAASGQLADAFAKAKTSLSLIGTLVGKLVGVVIDLGKALYPISGRVLKDLIGGLGALDKMVKVVAPALGGALGGALKLIEAVVKTVWPAVVPLVDVLLKLVGVLARGLVPIVDALKPVFTALGKVFKELEPPLAKVIHDVLNALLPAVKALSKPLADLVKALGPVLVGALKILDPLLKFTAYLIATMATAFGLVIEAAAKALTWIENHWHGIIGFFKDIGRDIVTALDNAWHWMEKKALQAALAIVEPFSHLPRWLGGGPFQDMKAALQSKLAAMDKSTKIATQNMQNSFGTMAKNVIGMFGAIANALTGAFNAVGAAIHAAANAHRRHHHHHHKQPSWMTTGPDPSVFGPPPPFSSGLGKHHHHLTAAQKRQQALQYALDKATVAVQKAKVGSKQWDKAVKREETALDAEIKYWNQRAHDAKLSKKLRDEALRKELQYLRELHALEAQVKKQIAALAAAKAQNEAQFLQSYVDIQNTFAPNATPNQGAVGGGAGGGGKTDTHLHEIKHEARETNRHLKAMREQHRHPGSRHAHDAAMAVTG